MAMLTPTALAVALAAWVAAEAARGEFVIAENGEARAVIVRPDSYESKCEVTAVEEMAAYLKQITGPDFEVYEESKAPEVPQIHMAWKDAEGQWTANDERRGMSFPRGEFKEWLRTGMIVTAPESGAHGILMLSSTDQIPDRSIAYDNVLMVELP